MANLTKNRARLDKAALFETLGYVPHAGQWTIHRSQAKRRVVACGTRFGKSVVATYEAVAFLLEPRERMDAWLVAPTYELTKRVFERVVTVLHEHMPHRILAYNERQHVIRVANLSGEISELRARSADKPAGLLGAALDVLIVDEADQIRDDCWDQYLAARTIDRDGRVLLISTPGSVNSWFFAQYRRGGRDAGYESFSMPSSSNPHISPAVIEAERARLTPETFAAQFEAKFIGQDNWPCDVCLGPKEGARSFISLRDQEQPDLCPACHGYVHEDGETAVELWPDGTRHTSLVRIMSYDRSKVPPIPGIPDFVPCERPDITTRTITFTNPRAPENPEAFGAVVDHIDIHPPIENPEELPDGVT